jgi:hypothetical protein
VPAGKYTDLNIVTHNTNSTDSLRRILLDVVALHLASLRVDDNNSANLNLNNYFDPDLERGCMPRRLDIELNPWLSLIKYDHPSKLCGVLFRKELRAGRLAGPLLV